MEAALRRRYKITGDLVPLTDGENSVVNPTDDAAAPEESWRDETELILDGCKIRKLDGAAAAVLLCFPQLEVLCLNHTNLSSIESFPLLQHLEVLEIQDNLLSETSGLGNLVEKVPNLIDLSLAGNKYKTPEELQCLATCKSLQRLDIEMNPLTKDRDYRKRLFDLLPNLVTIDGFNRSGVLEEEVDESDEELSGCGGSETEAKVASGEVAPVPAAETDSVLKSQSSGREASETVNCSKNETTLDIIDGEDSPGSEMLRTFYQAKLSDVDDVDGDDFEPDDDEDDDEEEFEGDEEEDEDDEEDEEDEDEVVRKSGEALDEDEPRKTSMTRSTFSPPSAQAAESCEGGGGSPHKKRPRVA